MQRISIIVVILIMMALSVIGFHEFLFPEIHSFVCLSPTIHPIPSGTSVPGYAKRTRAREAVVFIHGIRDNGRDAWRNKNGQYWPSLVASEAPTWDVYVEQYQDDVPVHEVGNALRVDLDSVFEDYDRVFVVAHSMGGLVIRDYLIRNPKFGKKVAGMFLLATPSLGSPLANLASKLGVGNKQSRDLRTVDVNPFMRNQTQEWKRLGLPIRTECAYETRKTWLFEVVDGDSANALCSEDAAAMDASHTSIAKPSCDQSPQNMKLMNYLNRLPPLPPPIVTESLVFRGPFTLARNGGSVTFSLSDAKGFADLGQRRFTVRNAVFSSPVLNESSERFAFDASLLYGKEDDLRPAMQSDDLVILSGLAASRSVVHFALFSDAGRKVHGTIPLTTSINFRHATASNQGEVKNVSDRVFTPSAEDPKFQLLLWTYWGGDHMLQIGDITLTLELELMPRDL